MQDQGELYFVESGGPDMVTGLKSTDIRAIPGRCLR